MTIVHSCTIEKRHYRNGFYVNWAQTNTRTDSSLTNSKAPDKAGNNQPKKTIITPESEIVPDVAIADSVNNRSVNGRKFILPAHEVIPGEKRAVSNAPPPDETPPPTKDRPNRKIVLLLAIAFFLVACIVITQLAFTPQWLIVTLFFFPLAGVMMYLIAMRYRRKLVAQQVSQRGSPSHTLSAHYHRFKVFLLLFFASALLGWFGYALVYSTAWGVAPIFGLLGVFMFGAGVGFTLILAVVLLVMLIAYLAIWRKDPTGVAKKRDPRPIKGQ